MEAIIAQIVFFAFLAVVGVMTTAVLTKGSSDVEEDAIREHFEEELKQKDRVRLVK